jgi:gliding motility-associated lipoprotein GldH
MIILFTLAFVSCTTVDLYERSVAIPGHAWKNGFRPEFTFQIKDTSSSYRLYMILRHSEKYNYTNIYVNLYARQPGVDSVTRVRYDLKLADENGWMASGMDDIYEHRIPLTPTGERFLFRKPGEYTFTLEQIMREDPLLHVYNAGIRIEKEP